MTEIFFILSGLLFGLSFLGGYYLYAIPVGIVCVVLGWLNRSSAATQRRMTEKIEKIVRHSPTQPVKNVTSFEMEVEDFNVPHIHEFRKTLYDDVENDVNFILNHGATLIKELLPSCHSVCVFFPVGKGMMQLRMHLSDSQAIAKNVVLKEGQGLAGQLLKEEVPRILEGDLQSGNNLQYYSKDVPVCSAAGVPIVVRQKRHGAVFVDSLQPRAFNDHTIELLRSFASLIGQMCYTASINFREALEKAQFHALFKCQEDFLKTRSVKEIYERIKEAVKNSLPFERLMILALDRRNPEKGRVVSCLGKDEEFYHNLEFSVHTKGLLLLCFQKRMILNRSLEDSTYMCRLAEDEKPSEGFKSLLAVPVVLDSESGEVGMVISVESLAAKRYGGIQQDLLRGIASAAGLSLEKTLAYEEKDAQASRDGLTGLINHRTFQEKLKGEKHRANRMEQSLGLMMMDIDKFKSVNDHYGHPAGDVVLKQTAALIKREVRADIDVVARYGGEEFVVMLVDADEKIVADTAERIRAAIENKEFDIGRVDPLKVTISIGSYLLSHTQHDVGRALKHADEALYKAKETGRNRVVAYK